MGESHVYPWGRTQVWLVGDRYKGNNLSKEPLIRIRQKFIDENGLEKFEQNSYSNEHKHNWNFWKLYICIVIILFTII